MSRRCGNKKGPGEPGPFEFSREVARLRGLFDNARFFGLFLGLVAFRRFALGLRPAARTLGERAFDLLDGFGLGDALDGGDSRARRSSAAS